MVICGGVADGRLGGGGHFLECACCSVEPLTKEAMRGGDAGRSMGVDVLTSILSSLQCLLAH